jgi:hypothetical protein
MSRSKALGQLVAEAIAGCTAAPLAEPATVPGPATAAEATTPSSKGIGSTTGDLDTLKVATWNLEWLHRESGSGTVQRSDADYDRFRGCAERLDADVSAVQKVDGEAALRRVFDDDLHDYHVASQSGVQLTGFAYKATLQRHPEPRLRRARRGQRPHRHPFVAASPSSRAIGRPSRHCHVLTGARTRGNSVKGFTACISCRSCSRCTGCLLTAVTDATSDPGLLASRDPRIGRRERRSKAPSRAVVQVSRGPLKLSLVYNYH